MTELRLFSIAWPVTALGPGDRVVLWVAGCDRDCPGCISPEMQPHDAGRAVPVSLLLDRLEHIDAPLNGITISGGEPFDQAPALALLIGQLRVLRPDWNVMVYTGYMIDALREDSGRSALLGLVDILIDGPFMGGVQRDHPLAGSGNQRVHYLTAHGELLRGEVEMLETGAMNFGLSRSGRTDMIIGVTDAVKRESACRGLGATGKTAETSGHGE